MESNKTKKEIRKRLNRASGPFRGIWPRLPEALLGIASLAIIAFCILSYSTTLGEKSSRLLSGNKYLALIDGMFNPFRNRQILLKSGLPIYDLKISHAEYAKIEETIQEALTQGWMDDNLKVWADARFIYDGQTYPVKVRVRGDLPNHWKDPKKSWRIKFSDQKIDDNGKIRKEPIFFNHRRQINLIIPIDRRFILSHFINSLMADAGLVVQEDQFVILRINGVIQGLYYEVEHFDKPLLAMHRRPETTIFGQNDRAMHFEQYTKLGTPVAADARYDVGSTRRGVEDSELALRAMQVLFDHEMNPTPENFRRARKVLDWKKYLKFRVLTTLCNTNHVRFGSDNLRLYYDPSRGLLEPVPWDVHIVKFPKEPGTIDFWNSHGPDHLQHATLMDPVLRRERNQVLWELIKDGGDSLMTEYDKLHNRIRPLAWADVLGTPNQAYKMDVIRKELQYNIQRAYKVMAMCNVNFNYKLLADSLAQIDVAALNFSGITLKKIQVADSALISGKYRLYEDTNNNGVLDREDRLAHQVTAEDWTIEFAFDLFIAPEIRYEHDMISGQYWEFHNTYAGRARYFLTGKLAQAVRHPLEWTPPVIKVAGENAVTGQYIPSGFISQDEKLPDNYIGITAYDASDPFDLDALDLSLEEFVQRHPQFKRSAVRPGAVELSGQVTISKSVIIPPNVPLIVAPGTDITMKPRISLLAYGGFTMIGKSEARIRIHGDGSGVPWGVFTTIRPPEKVVVQYADFEGASQAQINGILFTGGFAVHEGDLDLDQCRFINMDSEDCVNIKNGHLMMTNCLVQGSDSDALDVDFGTGEIRDCQFIDIGGDGVDISGTQVLVTGCLFERVTDKGTSVGENSHPIVYNNLYRNCGIGLSTKDLSHSRVANCTFVNNAIGIEAKRKKPMFGGASGEFFNCVFSANPTLLVDDYFSKGQVAIRHSVVDQNTDWVTCKTAESSFLNAAEGDYRLDPITVAGNGFSITIPDWLPEAVKAQPPQHPGIVNKIMARTDFPGQQPE